MILSVSEFSGKKPCFSAGKQNKTEVEFEHDTLLKNNVVTRTRVGLDRFVKAFTLYPAKGLAGSKNSNFYEFLAMGTVPYLIGSIMLISIFNSANKHFSPFASKRAAKLGNKMALGVILYAIFKNISKSFTTVPVKLLTGIDTELPYSKVNYLLQEDPEDYNNLTSIEYHKVGESVDFPRWDQLYGDTKQGEAKNWRYDKIAKKNGLGENLNDSDQDVKPIYKEVLVKSKLAKSFSSFLWAATGVAIAFQKPWEEYFNVATLKFWNPKEFGHSLKIFGKDFIASVKSLWKGEENSISKIERHSGKALIGAAIGVTVLGVLNTVNLTKKPPKQHADKYMDKHKESVVC